MKKFDISARRKRVPQTKDGPTIFTLARKAELLGDDIVVADGKIRLRNTHIADAENSLAFMEAKRMLDPIERQAADMLQSLRRRLFGFGVVPGPSFFRQMTAPAPPDAEDDRHDREGEPRTDQEKLEHSLELLARYEAALHRIEAEAGREAMLTCQRSCSGDWWPATVMDVVSLRKGLGVLVKLWSLGEPTMTKPTLVLDFDGVLHLAKTPSTRVTDIPDGAVPGAIPFLIAAQDVFRIAVHSVARSPRMGGANAMRQWTIDRFLEYFRGDWGAAWNYVSRIEFPPYKPLAHLTIDDQALCFRGDWKEFDPLALANFRPWGAQ